MPDLAAVLPTTDLEEAFLDVVDVEGKLTAALEDLGPIAGRDVVLLDAGGGYRQRCMTEIGAHVTGLSFPRGCDEADALALMSALPAGDADAVVAMWSELALPGTAFLAAAEGLLRPGGRLLLVHDYGRDDVWCLRPDVRTRQVEWSQRRGPFLAAGYRIRVIHCWWTFESPERARHLLESGFGALGADLASQMRRPRLEYQVAIYHRSTPSATAEPPADPEVARAVG